MTGQSPGKAYGAGLAIVVLLVGAMGLLERIIGGPL